MAVRALAGRVVLVTGGSRGIGAEVAVRRPPRARRVAVHYRTGAERSREGRSHDARAAGGRRRAFHADLATGARPRRLVARVIERLRAGRRAREQRRAGPRGPTSRLTPGEWDAVIADRPHRRLPHLPRGDAGDARAGLRLDREHRVAARPDGHRRDRGLLRGQGRADRADAIARARVRPAGHPGQRRCARRDDHRDDDRPRRQRRGPARLGTWRWAGSVAPTRWPPPWSSCSPTRRACSSARRSTPTPAGYMP